MLRAPREKTKSRVMASSSLPSTPAAAPLLQPLDGLQQLVESGRFKVWLVDQLGVLHDGKQPYPGAISMLEKLSASGAKVVVISNSSRSASTLLHRLTSFGFDPSLFTGAVTSGELTYQYLQRRDDAWFATLGRRCIHVTWSHGEAIPLEGLGLQVVEDVEEADFVLAHGTDAVGLPCGAPNPIKAEALEKILEQCAIRGIPMVVNRGSLAAKYKELGGEVKWMGKPDTALYESAMSMAGAVDASDSIVVGDSLGHDIKGANAAGIQSVFVTDGIHATELGDQSLDGSAFLDSVYALATKYDACPSYVLPTFKW